MNREKCLKAASVDLKLTSLHMRHDADLTTHLVKRDHRYSWLAYTVREAC